MIPSKHLEIALNQLASGVELDVDARSWYRALPLGRQVLALHLLWVFICNARPTLEDLEGAYVATLSPRSNPGQIVSEIIRSGGHRQLLHKLIGVSGYDRVRSFQYLVRVMSLADGRRLRERCRTTRAPAHDVAAVPCHWWHVDLGDPATVRCLERSGRIASESWLERRARELEARASESGQDVSEP